MLGSGITKYHRAMYVVCPAMIGEFTPASQRGAALSIYGAIYTLGSPRTICYGERHRPRSDTVRRIHDALKINAAILIASGMLGLLLLWPEADKGRVSRVATSVRRSQVDDRLALANPGRRLDHEP